MTAKRPRLHGLDAARFLAFCGMVLVNFRIAAEVVAGHDLPSLLTNALEGRAAALFVVLAGIGVSLARPRAALMVRRAAFLFALGLLNLTVFDADILHFYGVYFLLAVPFLAASDRIISISFWLLLGLSLVALVKLNYDAGWNWEALRYDDLWSVTGFLRNTVFNGWHPVSPWFCFMLLGLWLGRRDLSSAKTQQHMMVWGVLIATLGFLPGSLSNGTELFDLLNATSIPPGPFYILSASGSAVAALGLILRWETRQRAFFETLACPGRQSLTLYIAHILIGMGMLDAAGLLDGSLSTGAIFTYSLFFCVLSLAYALIWTRIAKRGPLEMVMRRVCG